jgi:MFS superfamily sulfate permease-like transporter
MYTDSYEYFIITPDSGLSFPSVDLIRTKITKLALKNKNVRTYILSMESWNQLDYTAATALASMVKVFEKDGKFLVFTNCTGPWTAVLKEAGLSNPPIVVWDEIEEYIKKSNSVIINLPSEIVVGNDPNGSLQTDFSSTTTISGTRGLLNTH